MALLRGETPVAPPTPAERIEMMRRHARLMAERRGERRGLKEFRKHAVQYLKGLPGSHVVKQALMTTGTLVELEEQLVLALRRVELVENEGAGREEEEREGS
jgi:tRNA-dihydrouridine synthase